MPLKEQEKKCVNLACSYLKEQYGGEWTLLHTPDDQVLSVPTPDAIVGNGTRTAAVEVKRIIDFAYRDLMSNVRSNEAFLAPPCGGFYYLNPPLDFGLPMSSPLRKLIRKEIERVAPTLNPGQKGAIRMPRQGHISMISSSGPPFIECLHLGPHSELMSRIGKQVPGGFLLIDDRSPEMPSRRQSLPHVADVLKATPVLSNGMRSGSLSGRPETMMPREGACGLLLAPMHT